MELAVGSLPDSVTISVLERIGQDERLSTTCLVCKRWYALCHDSSLLRRVFAHVSPPFELAERHPHDWAPIVRWVVARLRSLLMWLERYAGAVRDLSIGLLLPTGDFGFLPAPRPRHRKAMLAAAELCIRPCAATGLLEALDFTAPQLAPVHLPFDAAVAGQLTSLTSLTVPQPGGDLSLISALHNLRHVELVAVWETHPLRLPQSLTSLILSAQQSFTLPNVGLASLSALERLELGGYPNPRWSTPLPASICEALPALPRLRQLILTGFDDLPVELGQGLAGMGSSLQLLRMCEVDACHNSSLPSRPARTAKLQQLRQGMLGALAVLSAQLTGLVLYEVSFLALPPRDLSSLANLRALQLASSSWPTSGPAPSLPPGPWLAGLHDLSLDWHALDASWHVLRPAATPQLHRLLVVFLKHEERKRPSRVPGLRAFYQRLWDWAGAHPSLRRVEVEEVDNTDEAGMHGPHREVEQMFVAMRQKYPHLEIVDAQVGCWRFYDDMEGEAQQGS